MGCIFFLPLFWSWRNFTIISWKYTSYLGRKRLRRRPSYAFHNNLGWTGVFLRKVLIFTLLMRALMPIYYSFNNKYSHKHIYRERERKLSTRTTLEDKKKCFAPIKCIECVENSWNSGFLPFLHLTFTPMTYRRSHCWNH